MMKMDWFVCGESRGNRHRCESLGCKCEKRGRTFAWTLHHRCNLPVALQLEGSRQTMVKLLKSVTWWKNINLKYLEVGVVDGERRAEETLDDGHHRLGHVLLQGRVGVVPICGGVAHL